MAEVHTYLKRENRLSSLNFLCGDRLRLRREQRQHRQRQSPAEDLASETLAGELQLPGGQARAEGGEGLLHCRADLGVGLYVEAGRGGGEHLAIQCGEAILDPLRIAFEGGDARGEGLAIREVGGQRGGQRGEVRRDLELDGVGAAAGRSMGAWRRSIPT